MSAPRDVRIVYGHHHRDNRTGVWLHTPYQEAFVRQIKEIPYGERAWDPDETAWFVTGEYADRAIDLVIHHFGETLIVHDDGSEEYRDASGVTAKQERLF